MSSGPFSFAPLFRTDLPAPSGRWAGLPRYVFNGGHNDPELIPSEGLAAAAAAVLRRHGEKLAVYNLGQGPQGYEGLRDFLVDKLARRRAIRCTRDDILITTGSGQGIELVNAAFLQSGDTVLIEEFSFQSALTRLRKLGVKMVPVPMDRDGMQTDALAGILDDLKAKGVAPKLLYTIPTVQNPTGTVLSLERRHALLALARQHGFIIFEDECYTDILWGTENLPALYGMDPSQVIHIGSFSKTLAPALRVGYLVASWEVISRLLPLKTDGGTGALDQMVAAEYFTTSFEPHLETLSRSLKEKLDVMVEAVTREFGTAAELWVPEGGIFLWIRLPDAVDSRKLVAPAGKAGLLFNPGTDWACEPEAGKSFIRLCFALPSKDDIVTGVAEFARICFEETGIPARSGNVSRSKPA